jgi:hypothetical protein
VAIETIKVSDAAEAARVLIGLALPNDSVVFRGHSCETWRLESTLARQRPGMSTELSIKFMHETLDHFYSCLASVGKLPSHYLEMSARTELEYARHYGVPSPLIDFTRSPYVALWMAFDGVRPRDDKGELVEGNAAAYALDVNNLAILWQKHTRRGGNAFEELRWERGEQFASGYPVGELKYLEFPSSWNTRMLRQLGVFIYDSLQYGNKAKFRDLEDFIEKGDDPRD